ncbi:protein PFF0380w-like [Aphis craccivora]|uniref:Protein PFF0380w-like n=1 Tax=Aphis craccivora TaxID=307492 RepID=A0A6G0ZGW8_APHCR|nr:protein PFF0380w-like [Aphis craccivora]
MNECDEMTLENGQKNTTVVTKDTIILSESNPNNNNAPENVITVQGLIQKHFDIPLIISEDEQKVNDFIKNAQLLTSYENYKEKKKIDQFMEHLVDDSYVARGLGLITANVGRKAEFYLYSKYDNNFDNVVIKLKGRQGEIGQITIPNQNSTNSIDTKSIPMDYFYDEDRIKVTYTPFAEGVYTLTLVRNGLSICRSPYYISVEKSPTNSRSQIRLGTKKYKMVTKFAKAKHVPLETCDNSSPLIEPSKPSISRNILSTPEENSIRTDVMSIVTKFESNSIHFQKNDQKPRVNTSKKSTKTDLFDKISISADSNTQPEIETGNDYDTNINDLSSLSINSNSKSNNKKCSSNLDVSNRNSKSNYVNSIEIESNLLKKSNKKLDESIRNINDIPRVKNISSNHLEPTNSALLKESLNDKSLDDVEERNKTYKTNEPILGQNQIETFLDPIALVKSEIKCIDNEACTHNEVSCFDDNDRKAVIVKKNINELETHSNISMKQQFTDSTQYNINTTFTSVLTKITNDVCEKCSIKVLRILSKFPRDINITHNNNSNENCTSFETLLAQPISIHINIDNLFEKPISPTNEHKTNNLLTNSPINMKLMDTTDKDIKYHYINEIKPIDTTFNEIYCDINNTTTELMVKQNKHNGEIKKTINDKITNNFTIPLTKNNIDKPKTDHIENILSTDNKMQIQVQNVQKSSDHNMEKDKTNQIQFHEYINNELNDINKENGKILDKFDNIVTINNDKKCNEELVTKELKAKNDIISDEYKNIQSSFKNSQTVLASMEDKLPTSRYKPEDIRQEISNISNTNVILPENQKLIIENSIEPVLKSFKNEMVEKITQLYLNKDLASSENTSILENHNINLTNNLQKKQLHHNADKNKTKLTETIRSQLKNHFHINDISGMILNNKKTDNNQLYKYHENIIKTNMNPNEIHSQRLDEINFQTLESIAKNQLNKQQLDKESKIMILENVTPNIEIKKTIDDEKVQDMKIMLKNIPNGTSTKIKATTKTIKSNTSDETDVESNIDNKKKVQKIVVEIVTNNNKMIVDSIAIIIHEETEENKQVAKNNTPKPNYWIQINDHEEYTINAYHDAIKPIDKDEVIETEMTKISIKTDITIENNHKDRNEKEIEESIKHDLIIETPIIPVQKSKKVENINQTKIIQYIDSSTKHIEEPINVEIFCKQKILKNDVQTNKTKQNIKKESESCLLIDTSNVPVEQNNIIGKSIEHPISIENSNESVKESKVTKATTETKLMKNRNSLWLNKEEAIGKENNPEIEIKTQKSIDNTIKEGEPISLIKTPIISDNEKIIIKKKIEKLNKYFKDSKEEDIKTESKSILNNHTSITNIEEPIDNEDIPETGTRTEKSRDKIYKVSDPCSPSNIPTTSDEEKIILKETVDNRLPNEPPIKSAKVEPTQNTDSKTENVDEPNDINVNPETETQIETSTDKMNTESATYSRADIPTISDEEKRTIVETTEKPLLNDQPTKSIEIETTPNTDSPTKDVEEPIDQHIIPETQTQTDISTGNINTDSETYSLADITTTSDKEKIILEETAEKPILNEPPIKSAKVEPTQNTDSKTENVDEPNDINVIPETETQIEKSKDKMNTESATCSRADIPTTSDEEKRTIEETTGKPLLTDQPTKFIEIETTPNTDSPTEDIILEETAENPIQNEPSIRSVDEIQVIDINTDTETTTNSDSPTVNVEEPIDKDIIPEIATQTEKSKDNIYKISEPCSPSDIPTTSDEEKIILEETAENPILNEPSIKSVDDINVIDIITKSETTLINDSSIANVEVPINKDNVPETQIEIFKTIDNIEKESETCSHTDTSSFYIDERNIIDETVSNPLPIVTIIKSIEEVKVVHKNTESKSLLNNDSSITNVEEPAENPLLNEPPFKSEDEIKVIYINTKIETTPNTDPSTVNVEETIDKDIISETETQTGKSKDNINIERGLCSPFDTATVFGEEKIMIVETTEKLLLNETPIISSEEFKVVDINTETEPSPNTDAFSVNVEALIEKENIREFQIETDKLIDNSNKECESCFPTDKLSASDEGNNLTKETIEVLSPIEISIKSSIKSVEESKIKKVNTETVFVPNTDSLTLNSEEPLYEDYFSKIVIKTDKILDFIVKGCETCPPVDTSMYAREEIKGIDGTFEKLILIGPSFVVEETENLTSVDGFNTIVNTQSEKEYLKDIESPTRIDSAAFVKDQKVEENETVIENILTINTSAASVQAQIQVEEVIKDKSVILINDSDTFDELSPEEQKKIETVKISSITVIEEQTDINRGDVIYTCEESLDKTIVEKDIHSETTRTIDILAADVEEKRALEIELSEYATQVLNDTSTETIENPIKTKKNTENETTTPIVVAKSEVKKNEIKVMIENETSTPVHLASTNTEQTETDMVTEIASPNVNILNSNTKIVLIDKEMITENSNNPKHCYLKFGETSKIHSLENEDNLPEKSYGIKKLEMSVQRMKTSNENYYEKTFLQLEQTEKISVENKDKVDCENKNIIDDKLYTVNESDLNAILCASSLEEALTLLDSKIKFKFKHRKLSNKANSTPHIPKIQTSESRSSGTNTNFTDAREFFKKIEKKCKK